MEVRMPNDALKHLGDPPDEVEPIDPLLEEARGEGAVEEEPILEVPDEEPITVESLREELAFKERKLIREIEKERERRRRAALKADALQRQVQELIVERDQARIPQTVRLDHDEDGHPVLTREAVARMTMPAPGQRPPLPTPADPDAPTPGRQAYERMRNSLIDEDSAYGTIFSRLEAATKDIIQGLREAANDGEPLNTPDDVVEYLESSDSWSHARDRYPELTDIDPEDFVRAISSNRAARRLAEKVKGASTGDEPPARKSNGRAHPAPAPGPDLTSAARQRIRDKGNQSVRTRSTQTVDGISLDEAAKMDPEALLALPAQTRERVKKALRESFKSN